LLYPDKGHQLATPTGWPKVAGSAKALHIACAVSARETTNPFGTEPPMRLR
jgi:hypothetical protein